MVRTKRSSIFRNNPLQITLTQFVSATDYPHKHKLGKLVGEDLKQFNKFFSNMDELFGDVYYLGEHDKEHMFTDGHGWLQYHQFIKHKPDLAK